MNKLAKLLHDWVLVTLDPISTENVSAGGIILTEPHMLRTGVVKDTGPGKKYSDGPYIGIGVKAGERVAFFAGNMDTKQGNNLKAFINDDEALLPETAVLFVIESEPGEQLPRISK